MGEHRIKENNIKMGIISILVMQKSNTRLMKNIIDTHHHYYNPQGIKNESLLNVNEPQEE